MFRNGCRSGRKQIVHVERMKPLIDKPFTTENFGLTEQIRFTLEQSSALDRKIQIDHGIRYPMHSKIDKISRVIVYGNQTIGKIVGLFYRIREFIMILVNSLCPY